MAKRSLLNMVQGILSAMDGDEVTSISDSSEAQQVARVIEDVYWDLIDEHDLPHNFDLFALEGLADVTKPTHMRLPENVSKIEWIKYNRKMDGADPDQYATITYKEPLDFVQMCAERDTTDTSNNLQVPYKNNINLTIYNNSPPTWYTMFDDEYVIFDSWLNSLDTTLMSSKSLCYGAIRPSFTSSSNTFVPDLPENLFSVLYNEAMSRSMNLWKQSVLPKVEQSASRMRVRAQRNKWREDMVYKGVDYGRRPTNS